MPLPEESLADRSELPELHVGVIGVSPDKGWARQSHLPAFRSGIPGIKLRAVCGRQAESAEACAREFGAGRAFCDYEEMLASDELDVIAISVGLPEHVSLAQSAIDAGKHVFVEWPLAPGSVEARGLVARATQGGIRTAVGLQSRHSLVFAQVRYLIEGGVIGEVMAVNSRQVVKRRPRRSSDMWARHHEAGGNMLTIAVGHALDGLICMVGRVARLSATIDTRVTEWIDSDTGARYGDVTAPDQIAICGRMQSGASLAMHVGAGAHDLGHRIEILGAEGTLVVEAPHAAHMSDCTVWLGRRDGDLVPLESLAADDIRRRLNGPAENVGRLWRNFAAAIRSREIFDPDFSDALSHHNLIDKVSAAAESGKQQTTT